MTDYLFDDYKIKLLHKILPRTKAYVKSYDDQTKWMYFLNEDDDLWKKYNAVWDKERIDINKQFDSEPVYNKKFLKTR